MRLTPKQRSLVLEKSGGLCWYCGTQLGKGWHADHIKPIDRKYKSVINSNGVRQNKQDGCYNPDRHNMDNIVPSCPSCNNYKHALTVDQFRRAIERGVERARKSQVNFRFAERYGLIEVVSDKVVFWFEKQGLTL